MASGIIKLKTDAYPDGLVLPVAAWTTSFGDNPPPEYIHQTDWSGGMYQKLMPIARREYESPVLSNMYWWGQVWTVNGQEMRAGPLRTACGGTPITANKVWCFEEYTNNNTLYFASGANLYSITTGNPSSVSWGGTGTITDIVEMGDNLWVCQGTGAATRQYNGTTWSNLTFNASTALRVGDANYWASNPTAGGVACYLYWGAASSQRLQIGKGNSPITRIAYFDGDIYVFKTEGLYQFLPAQGTTVPAKARLLHSLVRDSNNGVAYAVYNGAMYYTSGDALLCYRGAGPSEVVPVPELGDETNIGRVYSLQSIHKALLVGFAGYAMILVEDPPKQGQYWWHYLAKNTGKNFTGIHYSHQLGLTRPRIFFGFQSDSTNNIQYTELVSGEFVPYQYESGVSVIFPAFYIGAELWNMWIKNIYCGTRNCDTNKTIQWAYSTDLTTWTNIGDPIMGNGFQQVTPTADAEGHLIWLKATFTTDVATISPILDYYRVWYYGRDPAKRVWTFPVRQQEGGMLPGGGRQRPISSIEGALYAARNQTSPCLLTIPEQDITDVAVWVDIRYHALRADVRRGDVTNERFDIICREA